MSYTPFKSKNLKFFEIQEKFYAQVFQFFSISSKPARQQSISVVVHLAWSLFCEPGSLIAKKSTKKKFSPIGIRNRGFPALLDISLSILLLVASS